MGRKSKISQAGTTLGKKGASRGGVARAEKLTKERRSEIAKAAAKARWSKKEEA